MCVVLRKGLVVALLLVAGCTPPALVMSDEPPGENCPHGGVRFELDGDVQYACDGADGEVTVEDEPPGANCPAGGVRITQGDTVRYVCAGEDGAPAPIEDPLLALCPDAPSTARRSGYDQFLALSGELTGAVQGDVVQAGLEGRLEVLASCQDLTQVPNLNLPHSARSFVFFVRPQAALVEMYGLWSSRELVEADLDVFGPDLAGAGTRELRTQLRFRNARIVALEMLTVPDPEAPGGALEVARVHLGFARLEVDWAPTSQSTIFDVNPLSAPLLDVPCAGNAGSPVRYFADVTGPSGAIPGDATAPGEEDTIAVQGWCHAVESGLFQPFRNHQPVVLVKELDRATVGLMDAFGDPLSVNLRGYRPDPGTGVSERFLELELTGAQVAEQRLDVHGDRTLERVALRYLTLRMLWIDGAIEVLLSNELAE